MREVRDVEGRVEGEVVSRDVGGEGVERSQWRIEPSEPPETRIGCTGCHATAVETNKCYIMTREESERVVQQTSFLWPLSTRNSFIARMSNTRTVWSREALATRLPLGDQERAWIVFLCGCLLSRF
jgi:hypothetical protein